MKIIDDVCDTSVPSDDEISVCSWTTDQGDYGDVGRCLPFPCDALGDNVTSFSAFASNVTPNGPTPCPNGLPDCSLPIGYTSAFVPVAMPFCCMIPADHVVFGPPAIGAAFYPSQPAACYESYMEKVDAHVNQHAFGEEQYRPPHAPGTWQVSTAGRQPPSQSCTCQSTPRGSNSTSDSVSNTGEEGSEPEPTTIILRNLPAECTREILLHVLDGEGFRGDYDFLHLPIDFITTQCLGYAIVNLASHAAALRVHERLHGFSSWPCASEDVCEVAWNAPLQGLSAHVERYRNSPLMHDSVLETRRPALFENGIRVPFPEPSKRIRAPRIRHQKADSVVEHVHSPVVENKNVEG